MTTSAPSQRSPRPVAFGEPRPEPFRSLLERAWAAEDGESLPRRLRRAIDDRAPAQRSRTRADRPRRLLPKPAARSLSEEQEWSFDDLEAPTAQGDRAAALLVALGSVDRDGELDADTMVDARRPFSTSSFDVDMDDPFQRRVTMPLANLLALEPLSPLTSSAQLRAEPPAERLPVSVGLPTSHYTRTPEGDLLRVEPHLATAPPARGRLGRERLLTPLAQLGASPPAIANPERAKALYRAALEALASHRREAALVHARLAVAHDPAHEGYRALVSDLESLLDPDTPALVPGHSL